MSNQSTNEAPKFKKLKRGGGGSPGHFYGPKYHCNGDRGKDGCGRTFIHPGPCPFCGLKLS